MAINSNKEALDYWVNEFGSPEYFSSYNELMDVENQLENFKEEHSKLQHEIELRDEKYMNEYKIDRNIDLHFLIETGKNYLKDCEQYAELAERAVEPEYDRDFAENIF